MIEILDAMQTLSDGIQDAAKRAGFTLWYPQGADKKFLPLVEERDTKYVTYAGDNGALRIEFGGNSVGLYYSENAADTAQKGDFTRLSLSLLEPEQADERDVRYIAEEFSETLDGKFAGGKKPQTSKKIPNAVSKAAVRNGAFYDLPSLGNRFTAIYPELREAFKENVDTYGEFLADDFFLNHGNKVVHAVIRENNPQKMRKLFNLLNEMYDNGVNDVQSLIVVTILAEQSDEQMIANCVDYMSDELCVNVIRVNKLLSSSAGRTQRMRLENPPRYKPKKERKSSNLLSSLMGGGGMPGM